MSGSPRLPALPEERWSSRLEPVRRQLGTVLNVHRVIAHNAPLLEAWGPLRRHLAIEGSLEPRHRELVILRVADRLGVAYEWHHHVARARAAGVGDEDIEAVRVGPGAGWPHHERALLTAVDELLEDVRIGDETWNTLAEHLSTEQLLDLIFTVGIYNMLSMLINSAGIEIEDD